MKNLLNKTTQYIKYVLVILGIILVILCYSLLKEYRSLRRTQMITNSEQLWRTIIEKRQPLTAKDVDLIRSWMTFDYINKVFNIPPDYFKTKLTISDSHYPNLLLYRYAKSNHLDQNVFLGTVASTTSDYLNGKR